VCGERCEGRCVRGDNQSIHVSTEQKSSAHQELFNENSIAKNEKKYRKMGLAIVLFHVQVPQTFHCLPTSVGDVYVVTNNAVSLP